MIRIFCMNISTLEAADYDRLYEKASWERKARADRYRRREDALRCVTADALLQRALGTDWYTVERSADGKPYLPERPSFHYNLSHSGNWVVLAFGDREVGVDVEQLRRESDIQRIADRFFAPEEQQELREKPGRSRFFEIWTGKESYVKYLGTGLRKDLTSFSVLSLEPQLQHRWLDEEHCLSVCTEDTEISFEFLQRQQLL